MQLITYESSIQSAFADVENALVARGLANLIPLIPSLRLG
jgi:hypothetical protein